MAAIRSRALARTTATGPRTAPSALRITARDARRLAVLGQRLAGPRPKPDARGAMEVIHDIGYLQLDPTNVVARNPLLVLWSRLGRYGPALLDELLAKRRHLFETVSLIVPISDLAIHAGTMRLYRGGRVARGDERGSAYAERTVAWVRTNAALRRHVIGRLRREGPLPLTAFEDRAVVGWTSSGWTSDRNVSQMLSFLQRQGEVVVAGRRRGQKLWALADGWLPAPERITDLERERRATERAVRTLGVASVRQLTYYYAFGRYVTVRALAALERDGRIVRVQVVDDASAAPTGAQRGGRQGIASRRRVGVRAAAGTSVGNQNTQVGNRELPSATGPAWYAPAGVERRLREVRDGWEGRTTLLSPFDNLIIDRARAEKLFGFVYRMEIYVPPHLRKRGFWAMPILHADQLIGTVDPRFERDEGTLVVNRVVAEPGAPGGRAIARAIARAVEELAGFVGARDVKWPRKLPAEWIDLPRA